MFRTIVKMILDAIKRRFLRTLSRQGRSKSIFPTAAKAKGKRRGIADSGESGPESGGA